MVVKLSVALYADVYPSLPARQRSGCAEPKRQKICCALPALVEDDSEAEMEREHCHVRAEALRRQKTDPHRRRRVQRSVLPSLSEDEEP
ncbi:unnamed protein product, partial [Iphiclides podalirius]